jgi:pimeloyl-ACP methyl ester carboxylesterase
MFIRVLISLAIVLLGLIAWLWTPNTSFDETFEKYGAADAQFVTLKNGQRLHIRDFGDPEGRPLILIHGTSDSLLTWGLLTKYLPTNLRFISLDLPGHGFSGAQPAGDYELTKLVATLVQLMDTLQLPSATLVGNSLGGGVAWRTALTHPQRVDSLILLDPSGAPRTTESKSNIGFKLLKNPVGRFFGQRLTPRQLIKKSLIGSVYDSSLATEERVDQFWELLRLPGNREALMSLASAPRSGDTWQKINEVVQPTLIVWGAEDQIITVDNAEKFAAKLPNNALKIYDDIGHLPMLEAPERLAQDIEQFLKTL